MTSANQQTLERERLLYDRLAACLEADGEAWEALRAPIAADFPEFADELREFFDGHDILERIAAPLRVASPSASSTDWADPGPGSASPAPLPSLSEYEIVREIARGGMGVVYEARHKNLGRSVALKMIRLGISATEKDVQRFQEEARRVAQLDHPDIVPLHEAGHERGHHYFTMRLMEGGSLADRIAGGGLTPRHAAGVASRIARALHFAHQRGILHCDVKPGNVLFDNEGRPHLGDFGLASQLDPVGAVSRLDAAVGTPVYMAPEVVRRVGEITTGVDVYGLGAVLYELLTGRPPFRAGCLKETLSDIAHRDAERPRLLVRGIDTDLEAICLKCLNKEPDHRYGSAEALAEDLERWLRGEPVEARRSSAWRRVAKWARRSPVVAGLTVLSVAATMACITTLAVTNVTITREKREKTRALEAQTKALAALSRLRARERRLTYLQGIALADREVQSGSTARAERLLGELPAELRGLEWNYLLRLCHAERATKGAPADPSCVAVHPVDGRVYVGGGPLAGTGEILVFDAAVQGELKRLRFSDAVVALAISPDGGNLVTAVRAAGPVVWYTSDGRKAVEFDRHGGDVRAVAFGPAGKRVVSGGCDGVTRIWDTASGNLVHALREDGATMWAVAFSPDGRRVATGSSGRTVALWDAESGRPLLTIAGHRGLIRSVAFSPDGQRLVSASDDNTARVWDVATGSELATLAGHAGLVTRAVFSPDGGRIATAGVDGTVRVWDAATCQQVLQLRGHSGSVWDVAFSPDGQEVVSVGEDRTVKIWAANTHGMPRLLDRRNRRIRRIEGSVNGRAMALLGEDGAIEVWGTETDQRLCTVVGSYGVHSQFGLSGDGRFLAVRVAPQLIRVARTIDGAVVQEIVGPSLAQVTPALSDDGSFLAVAQTNRIIAVWDIERAQVVERMAQPEGEVLELALGPAAGVVAAAIAPGRGSAGRVFLWRRGRVQGPLDVAAGSRLALSQGGELLAAYGDTGVVTVCNTATGSREYRLDGMAGPVRAVAFAGPGRLLTGDAWGTVTIWDTATRREALSLRDMTHPVDFLAFQNGQAVLCATRDGSVRRWEVGPVAGRSGERAGPVATLSEEYEP
jgi:WD40 repeat protein